VALVTGAFGGLGAHFAETLGKAGASIVLTGRRREDGERLVSDLRARGVRVESVLMDVSEPDSIEDAFEQADRLFGSPTIIINNAGVATTGAALDVSDELWHQTLDVNLGGAWRVARAAAKRMKDCGGSIINIASILGLRVAQQVPAYCASKAALIHLTRALALEWAKHQIRVNALAPGYIATDINHVFFETEAGQALIKRIPQRRLGQPHELDGALLLLASDAGSFITGSVLAVDGGHLVNSL